MRVLILGGGPAGITAALQAREFGSDVTLIEAAHVGGTSVNEGPAPIRTLARAARLMRDTSAWSRFGIIGERPRIDLKAALENAERVARYAHDRKGLSDFIRDRGVELIEGRGPGTFCDDHTLGTPDGKTWSGDRII